jgi:hypothetical protein
MPEQADSYMDLYYYRPADTGFCITGKWYKAESTQISSMGNGKYLCYNGGLPYFGYRVYKERLGLVEYFSGSFELTIDTALAYTVLNGTPCGNFVNLSTNDVEINDNSISMSPNPAQDVVTVDMQGWAGKPYTLTVTDVTGAMLMSVQSSQPKTQLDIRQLPAGAYMLSLQTGKDIIHHKLVKY